VKVATVCVADATPAVAVKLKLPVPTTAGFVTVTVVGGGVSRSQSWGRYVTVTYAENVPILE